MAQPLRMFSALEDDWGFVSRILVRVLIPPARGDLLLLPPHVSAHVCTYPHTGVDTGTSLKKSKSHFLLVCIVIAKEADG